MKRAAGLRCTSRTSGPPSESRTTITDAATRGTVTSPVLSSSPGPGRSTSTGRTLLSSAEMAGQRYICVSCGFIYDPDEGDPDGGVPPGTSFDDIPDDWFCPVCGARKSDFEPYEE